MIKFPLIKLATISFSVLCWFSAATSAKANSLDIIKHYADIAEVIYTDSLTTAKNLDKTIDAFLENPSQETLDRAKLAWVDSRIPYLQTEVYRFGNAIVDDWEGRVNAWPLDEGLIDYVDTSYGQNSEDNHLYTANIIANPVFTVDGKTIDASKITPDLLENSLHEAAGIEANVATGYHAIEFLLWGQDLNGTEAGAGNRPYTDFSLENGTNGNCDRRRQYLDVVSDLLVTDLQEMVNSWSAEGKARKSLIDGEVQDGIRAILTGMGSLSYGELAGERMKLGLLLGDPEEEQDCFSDNTHHSHYYNALGIQNAYLGMYRRIDGTIVAGPAISDLIVAKDKDLDAELKTHLQTTLVAMTEIVERALSTETYDQMIASGNEKGNAVVQAAIDALIAQTKSIERVIATLKLGGIGLEGSDSLDKPSAIFQ